MSFLENRYCMLLIVTALYGVAKICTVCIVGCEERRLYGTAVSVVDKIYIK